MRTVALIGVVLLFGLVIGLRHGHHQNHTGTTAVTIDYVTIPSSVNEGEIYPNDGAETGKGHYAYLNTAGFLVNPDIELGGKLVYDGRTVYAGNDLEESYVISQNGLHYAYMRYGSDSSNIYVDNKLVKTIPSQTPTSVSLYGVSNNGQQYAYAYAGLLRNMLYRNSSLLYTSSTPIELADFDSDLSHYIAAVQFGNKSNSPISQFIKDGHNIGTGIQAFISSNGAHTIALMSNTGTGLSNVQVDGKPVGKVASTADDPQETIVNDNGSYAFTDFANHSVNMNGKADSIPTAIPDDCGQHCLNLFAINQDATHYVVGDYKPVGTTKPIWDLDGKPINLNGAVEGLEFNGNTLYVYRWSH